LTSFAAIRALVDERDLVLVTGKGGTGKSTLVAALASLAAKRRGRAVALELSAHPTLAELVPRDGGVRTTHLDLDNALAPSLGRLLGLPVLAGAVLANPLLKLFIRTSPSIREMVVLDQLAHLVDEAAAERVPVVVGLHATGHALSLLGTPRAVREMLRVGPLARIAARVEALLTDARRCELLAVSLPEELPVNETIELLQRAAEIRVASRVVLVNQMPEAPVDPADAHLLDEIRRKHTGVLARIALAARGELDALALARRHVDRLRASVDAEVLTLPRLPASSPSQCVARLVEVLGS
jgi:anion-transporting  ArsA/GET3 family ATPase